MIPMESNELSFWQSRSVVGGKLSAPFELTDIPKLAKDVRHVAHATRPAVQTATAAAAAYYGTWVPADAIAAIPFRVVSATDPHGKWVCASDFG